MPQQNGTKDTRKPLTVLLEPELEQRLHAERAVIAASGLRVSLSQVAARAMRRGFEAGTKE